MRRNATSTNGPSLPSFVWCIAQLTYGHEKRSIPSSIDMRVLPDVSNERTERFRRGQDHAPNQRYAAWAWHPVAARETLDA